MCPYATDIPQELQVTAECHTGATNRASKEQGASGLLCPAIPPEHQGPHSAAPWATAQQRTDASFPHPTISPRPRSPHCSSVPSGHCCSPSQSQGTGMHLGTQVAWREAAHVGLVGTVGERDPGLRSAWMAASGALCTHPMQVPAWESQRSPYEGDTGPSQEHTRTS